MLDHALNRHDLPYLYLLKHEVRIANAVATVTQHRYPLGYMDVTCRQNMVV